MTTALEGVRVQRHVLAAFYPRENPVPIVQEAGLAPGPVWTGAKNFTFTGIRSPDRPARSQSIFADVLISNCLLLLKITHLSLGTAYVYIC